MATGIAYVSAGTPRGILRTLFGFLTLLTAASACSRSSALLGERRRCGVLGAEAMEEVSPLRSSTPCRRIRLRLFARDQLTRICYPANSKAASHATTSGLALSHTCQTLGVRTSGCQAGAQSQHTV